MYLDVRLRPAVSDNGEEGRNGCDDDILENCSLQFRYDSNWQGSCHTLTFQNRATRRYAVMDSDGISQASDAKTSRRD